MEFGVIANIVLAGIHLFSDERKRYFEKQVRELQEEIDRQEDAEFHKKDMNAKGQAQRELQRRKVSLTQDFAKNLQEVKLG